MWESIGRFADIFGIISFIMSILLLIKSNAIKKELTQQKSEYKKRQSEIVSTLIALRDNVWQDNITSLSIRSQIRTELFTHRKQYSKMISYQDHWKFLMCLRILKDPYRRAKKKNCAYT